MKAILFEEEENYLLYRENIQWWKDLKRYSQKQYQYWRTIEIHTCVDSADISFIQPGNKIIYPLWYHSCYHKGYWFCHGYDYPVMKYTDKSLYEHCNDRWLRRLLNKKNFFAPIETVHKQNDSANFEEYQLNKKIKQEKHQQFLNYLSNRTNNTCKKAKLK